MSGFLHIPILIGTIAFVLSPSAPMAGGPPQPLTSCNQNVEGDVYLTGDLDCTGVGGFGVNLMKRATLDLRGFSILNAEQYAVQCFKRCSVVGPGSIVGSGGGIWAPHRLDVVDVSLIDNTLLGIGSGKLTMTRSSIDGSQVGITSGIRARLIDSSVTGSEWSGIVASATIPPASFEPCTHGRVFMWNSTVTGNGLGAGSEECETRQCVDVVSCREPRLDATSSCGTSLKDGTTESWGVCALD
jgi:hypothetical protein